MRKILFLCVACGCGILFFLGGCREEQAFRYDPSEVAVSTNYTYVNSSTAGAIPYARKVPAKAADEEILPAFLLVSRDEAGIESADIDVELAMASDLTLDAAELLLLDEVSSDGVVVSSYEEPAVAVKSVATRIEDDVVADTSVVSSSANDYSVAVVDTPVVENNVTDGWVDRNTYNVIPQTEGPELDPSVGDVIRPGALNPQPMAEVMISYADTKHKKKETIELGLANIGWVDSKWGDDLSSNGRSSMAY
ncbi:MAG: hypothetical protein JXR97_01430 [Planctomycetes bacterium]|nr:hypothetical protein [Planctomycetota bacterium]